MLTRLEELPRHQSRLLAAWLPGAELVRDLSWGLVDRHVLELRHGGMRYVAKTGGPDDHHIDRELRAHREWLAPWTSLDRAPTLVHGDADARLLVTRYLPGELAQHTPHADRPETFRQAGELLALLHAQAPAVDDTYELREADKAVAWLDKPHRIAAGTERRLREEIASWDTSVATVLVPTHGDWSPRNWIVDDGVVSVIDFGRADLRPAQSDLARLAAGDFRRNPALEQAFLDGYGPDPRSPDAWRRQQVREAIGTAVWAHLVGDGPFEAHGHRMIADVLEVR